MFAWLFKLIINIILGRFLVTSGFLITTDFLKNEVFNVVFIIPLIWLNRIHTTVFWLSERDLDAFWLLPINDLVRPLVAPLFAINVEKGFKRSAIYRSNLSDSHINQQIADSLMSSIVGRSRFESLQVLTPFLIGVAIFFPCWFHNLSIG
jgi:hypothetical protein